jgi:hypothetical protein
MVEAVKLRRDNPKSYVRASLTVCKLSASASLGTEEEDRDASLVSVDQVCSRAAAATPPFKTAHKVQPRARDQDRDVEKEDAAIYQLQEFSNEMQVSGEAQRKTGAAFRSSVQ